MTSLTARPQKKVRAAVRGRCRAPSRIVRELQQLFEQPGQGIGSLQQLTLQGGYKKALEMYFEFCHRGDIELPNCVPFLTECW